MRDRKRRLHSRAAAGATDGQLPRPHTTKQDNGSGQERTILAEADADYGPNDEHVPTGGKHQKRHGHPGSLLRPQSRVGTRFN